METIGTHPVLLRRKEVESRTGLKRSKIYDLMSEGKFPAPIKLGYGKCVAWVESDIEDWIQRQIDGERRNLTKSPRATRNFLQAMLCDGAMPEAILRDRAEAYGIMWPLIERALADGVVTRTILDGMDKPSWSLVGAPSITARSTGEPS